MMMNNHIYNITSIFGTSYGSWCKRSDKIEQRKLKRVYKPNEKLLRLKNSVFNSKLRKNAIKFKQFDETVELSPIEKETPLDEYNYNCNCCIDKCYTNDDKYGVRCCLRYLKNYNNLMYGITKLSLDLPKNTKGLDKFIPKSVKNLHLFGYINSITIPDGIEKLFLDGYVETIYLPESLLGLSVYGEISEFISLPKGLKDLCIMGEQEIIPDLPSGLEDLDVSQCPYLYLGRITLREFDFDNEDWVYDEENIVDYSNRWKNWKEEQSKKRCNERAAIIWKELGEEVWNPKRLGRLLELGGFEAIDNMWLDK